PLFVAPIRLYLWMAAWVAPGARRHGRSTVGAARGLWRRRVSGGKELSCGRGLAPRLAKVRAWSVKRNVAADTRDAVRQAPGQGDGRTTRDLRRRRCHRRRAPMRAARRSDQHTPP